MTKLLRTGLSLLLASTCGTASAALPVTSQPGTVQVRYWDNLPGSKIENLTNIVEFPDNPTGVGELTSLQGLANRGDDYGTLVMGYIEPPESGEYRFFVSGDDETQFLLSNTESRENANLIASVPGWTGSGVYNKYSSQTSGLMILNKGQRYYFEIRHKEGSGDDYYSVAWQGPGISQQVIGSEYIHSLGSDSVSNDPGAYSLGYRVGFLDGSQGLPFNPDYPPLDDDSDGLYDNWEIAYDLSPANAGDASSDPDEDFLTAADEFLMGTAENDPDTDGDGIPDGVEFAYNLDPLDPADANYDLDGDGLTNLEEHQANTSIDDPEQTPEAQPTEAQPAFVPGFAGQYFQGTGFDRFILTRTDPSINFTWGSGNPAPELSSDNFSVRWSGLFTAPHSSGTREYRFTATSDDGVRLDLGGQRVINDWSDHRAADFSHTEAMDAGETLPLTMEYYEKAYDAVAKLTVTDLTTDQAVSPSATVTSPDPTATHSQDTDGDGMPDTWEVQQGLNPWVNDASEVSNNDGVTNIQAFENGLSPWTLTAVDTSTTETSEPSPPPTTSPEAQVSVITISWTAPLTRMDGSSIALSEIQYYLIEYGQNPDQLDQTQRVDGAENSSELQGFTPGTWYFTLKVIDNDDLTSQSSEPVSYVVN